MKRQRPALLVGIDYEKDLRHCWHNSVKEAEASGFEMVNAADFPWIGFVVYWNHPKTDEWCEHIRPDGLQGKL